MLANDDGAIVCKDVRARAKAVLRLARRQDRI